MKLLKKSPASATELISKFSALGDSTRFKLFQRLMKDDGICVSELAAEVDISNAGVSQQLKVMEQAGIIRRERNGQKICYRIDTQNADNQYLLNLIKG